MGISYTSRRDFGNTAFKWQCACLAIWLVLILYFVHRYPGDGQLLLFLLPAIGFFAVKLIPGTGFDFQGVVFAGSFFCCSLSSALYEDFHKNRIWDVIETALAIVCAMAFGFVFFRLMGKAFQRLA